VILDRLPALWGHEAERVWPLARALCAPATLAIARGSTAYGQERMPATGGGVIAVNHLSAIDPTLVGIFSPRPIYFMTKIELLSIPVAGEIIKWTGAFPVKRGASDRDAVRIARSLVSRGKVVCLFVEGTRQRHGYPGRVQPGATMIAMRENVPIIPCGLYSTGWNLRNRMACALVWGDPIDLSPLPRNGRGYQEGGEIVGAEILRLWRQAGEAVAAGMPPELPDGTPRGKLIGVPLVGALAAH